MQFVTVWALMEAIGSQLQVSTAERAETLRLNEEVAHPGSESTPSPFPEKTMGDLRRDVITGLAASFARAFRISRSAAAVENVLHNSGDSGPALFDLRQTGLPRKGASALRSELGWILIGAAQFEKRLIIALSAGKFRNYPAHGGAGALGMSPDDWGSHPNDSHALRNIVFDAAEIIPRLRTGGIALGIVRDAFNGEVVEDISTTLAAKEEVTLDWPSNEGSAQSTEPTPSAISERTDVLSPLLIRALKEVVKSGVPVDRLLCAKAAYQVLVDWADKDMFPNSLTFVEKGRLAYLLNDEPKLLSSGAVKGRVDRAWPKLLPILESEQRDGG